MASAQQGLGKGRFIALVERLETVDAFYGITPEERNVLDVIHGIADLSEESEG